MPKRLDSGMIVGPTNTVTYTLASIPAVPNQGDSISATGTFPAAAFRQSHNAQFHQNPYGQVTITQGNTVVFSAMGSFERGAHNPDGSYIGSLIGTIGPLDGSLWDSTQPAIMQFSSGYFTDTKGVVKWNQVAFVAVTIPAAL